MQPAANVLLETDLIRTFVTISETGSFSAAARRVLRTPSAVSMQMKRLEEQLGRPLFVRNGRSVALTPDGQTLLAYGRQMLEINEEAVSRFLVPPLEGRIRFGAPDDFGTRFLPNILARFAVTHPHVEVDVVLAPSAELEHQVKDGEVDLTLVTGSQARRVGATGQGDAAGQVIFTEALVWAGVKGGRSKDADPVPLALAGPGCPWRAAAVEALDRARRSYRIAYTSENCQGQLAALLSDLAIAPLPRSLVGPGYERLGDRDGLPEIGDYEIRLVEGADIGTVGRAFAAHVLDSFAAIGG